MDCHLTRRDTSNQVNAKGVLCLMAALNNPERSSGMFQQEEMRDVWKGESRLYRRCEMCRGFLFQQGWTGADPGSLYSGSHSLTASGASPGFAGHADGPSSRGLSASSPCCRALAEIPLGICLTSVATSVSGAPGWAFLQKSARSGPAMLLVSTIT